MVLVAASFCVLVAQGCSAFRWATFSQLQALAESKAARCQIEERLGQSQKCHLHFSPGRPEPHRYLGSKAGCALQYSRRIQTDQNQMFRESGSSEVMPKLGKADGQGDADSFRQLHARRSVQSHRRHLPDDDRLHA